MDSVLLPTSRAQVSGHRFLVRRLEHGLVLGDIRMIHDPLSRRRRALVFGLVACVLMALGSGLFAFMAPKPNPGDAPLVRTESGALYVRIADIYHPVSDLSSARLILNEAAEPAKISAEIFGQAQRGGPVGISGAPTVIARHPSPDRPWALCHTSGSGEEVPERVDILEAPSNAQVHALPAEAAVIISAEGQQWLVDHKGRSRLPEAHTHAGKAIREVLGIDSATAVRELPAELINVLDEYPPMMLPEPLPEVVGENPANPRWMRFPGEIELIPISHTQGQILLSAGADFFEMSRAHSATQPRAEYDLHLPKKAVHIVDPHTLCFSPPEDAAWEQPDGGASLRVLGSVEPRTDVVLPLPAAGEIPPFDGGIAVPRGADGHKHPYELFFHRALLNEDNWHEQKKPAEKKMWGAVGVISDMEHGSIWVISDEGIRHHLAPNIHPDVLGLPTLRRARWEIIRLLPEGAVLDPNVASQIRVPGLSVGQVGRGEPAERVGRAEQTEQGSSGPDDPVADDPVADGPGAGGLGLDALGFDGTSEDLLSGDAW